MKLLLNSIFVLFTIIFTSNSYGQSDEPVKDPLKIEPISQTKLFHLNEQSTVKIFVDLPVGYHGYVDSLKFNTDLIGAKIESFEVSPVVDFFDKFTKKQRKGFANHSEINLKIIFSEIPKEEHGQFKLQMTYQACTEKFCLLPTKKNFEFPYSVSVQTNAQSGWFDNVKNKNIIIQLILIFLAGILTSLTPCIFPMIPITLSILGTRTINQTRKKSFILTLFYVLGIATTYSIFGYAAAKTGTLFGNVLSKPWVVLTLAAVFYTMAISMFGFFEIKLPQFIQKRLHTVKVSKGYLGAFVYGLIAGIVASPCVGPVLVGLLAHVSQLKSPVLGISFLFTYAMGMGVLFIVLGSVSELVHKIPKAGPWMNLTKFIFGVSMISVALYYIHNVFSDRVFWGFVCGSVILVTSLYGAFENYKTVRGWRRTRKWVMAAMFCLAFGIMFKVLFTDWVHEKKPIDTLFKPYSEIQLEEALAKGQPVIIDFFAEWCVACKELDKYTYADTEVKSKLDQFLLLKVDATVENEEVSRILSKFKVIGLPTVIFYNSKGQMRKELTLTGFEPPPEFLKRLKSLESTQL